MSSCLTFTGEYFKNRCDPTAEGCIPCPNRIPSCKTISDGYHIIQNLYDGLKYLVVCERNRTVSYDVCNSKNTYCGQTTMQVYSTTITPERATTETTGFATSLPPQPTVTEALSTTNSQISSYTPTAVPTSTHTGMSENLKFLTMILNLFPYITVLLYVLYSNSFKFCNKYFINNPSIKMIHFISLDHVSFRTVRIHV